jgi:hypothetical protein
MALTGIKGFNQVWSAARQDDSRQSYKVAYAELKAGEDALLSNGKLSRAEAKGYASTLASDPVLTKPAVKEARAFLETIGADKLDSTTVEAMKADFSVQAVAPFKYLDVPGRVVKNTIDLPDAVQKAAAKTTDGDGNAWDVEVRKTTLAGQPALLVHSTLQDGELEKVELFSAAGKSLAKGEVWDPMSGFSW